MEVAWMWKGRWRMEIGSKRREGIEVESEQCAVEREQIQVGCGSIRIEQISDKAACCIILRWNTRLPSKSALFVDAQKNA